MNKRQQPTTSAARPAAFDPNDIMADLAPEHEVARAFHYTTQTLRTYRRMGVGPECIRIGRRWYYFRSKFPQWFEKLRRGGL
jgi:hypothetical protein